MWTIKKILVPTDFSRASEAALETALGLAKKFDASIVLMHAYQPPIYAYPAAPLVPVAEFAVQIENASIQSLDAAVAAHKVGVPILTGLYVGAPWEQILRAAKEHEIDLIVMGSRGLRGLPRALMGSTAERVVRYATIPVMTMHGPPESGAEKKATSAGDDRPLDQWLI